MSKRRLEKCIDEVTAIIDARLETLPVKEQEKRTVALERVVTKVRARAHASTRGNDAEQPAPREYQAHARGRR